MSLFNRRFFICGGGVTIVSGCGFKPVYRTETAAAKITGMIRVQNKNGRTAFEFRDHLESRLGVIVNHATYYLTYVLTIKENDLLVVSNVEIMRYNLIGAIEYSLIKISTNEIIFQDHVTNTTSYSANSKTYSTHIAEQAAYVRLAHTLGDQIYMRLSITAKDWSV